MHTNVCPSSQVQWVQYSSVKVLNEYFKGGTKKINPVAIKTGPGPRAHGLPTKALMPYPADVYSKLCVGSDAKYFLQLYTRVRISAKRGLGAFVRGSRRPLASDFELPNRARPGPGCATP
jgi:hypothetical protein